jgi:hypothetical protein
LQKLTLLKMRDFRRHMLQYGLGFMLAIRMVSPFLQERI